MKRIQFFSNGTPHIPQPTRPGMDVELYLVEERTPLKGNCETINRGMWILGCGKDILFSSAKI